MREHPIPPVTEALQYRAIGLVRGVYIPSDPEIFSRGTLQIDDGENIEAVVLGKVISLMRRHVCLENPHLWVVYPRNRDVDHLHLQISGIWEPSTLNKVASVEKLLDKNSTDLNQLVQGDNYFSIRGELIYTKPADNDVVIKIRQSTKSARKKNLPFKLKVKGEIPLDYLKHFISLEARREGQKIHVESFDVIAQIDTKESVRLVKKNESRN